MGKYDIPDSVTEYKSMFVDPGMQAFKTAADIYTKRFDENKQATDLLYSTMAEERFVPGEEDQTKEEIYNNINSQLGSVVDQGAYHLADMAVNKAVRYYTSDPILTKKRQNYQEHLKTKTKEQEIGINNLYIPNLDEYQNFKTVTQDEEGNEVINTYTDKAEVVQDYAGTALQLIGNIAQDQRFVAGFGIAGEQLKELFATGQIAGVSEAKVNNVIKAVLDAYKMTPAGAQLQDRLMNSNQNSYGRPLETQQATDAAMTKMLQGYAKNQISYKEDYAINTDVMSPSSQPSYGGPNRAIDIFNSRKDPKPTGFTFQDQLETYGVEPNSTIDNSYSINPEDGIIIDIAKDMTEGEISNILQGTIFENVGNKDLALTIATSLSFSADEESVNIALAQLGLTPNDLPAAAEQANIVSQRLAETELGNMGTKILKDIPISNAIFKPSLGGDYKVIGNKQYPVGTWYIPADQIDDDVDLGGLFDLGDDLKTPKGKNVISQVQKIGDIEYAVIPNALGAGNVYTDPARNARNTANTYNISQSDLFDMQGSLVGQFNQTVKNEFMSTGIKNTAANQLSIFNISSSTINSFKDIIGKMVESNPQILQNVKGDELSMQFKQLVDQYKQEGRSQYEAEVAALQGFEQFLSK